MSSGQASSSSGCGGGGGVTEHVIKKNDPRRTESSLTKQQLQELTRLVCIVEVTYGMPMEIEWAFITGRHSGNYCLDLKLLQARPITTLLRLGRLDDDTTRYSCCSVCLFVIFIIIYGDKINE